jgi:hypothetical protein
MEVKKTDLCLMAVMAMIPAVYSSNRLSPIPITATTFKMLHSIAEEEDVVSLLFVIIVSQVWTSG